MFCTKCGSKVEDGSRFCDTCGERVSSERIDNMDIIKKEIENKFGELMKRKKIPWKIIGVAAVAVLAAVILLNTHKCGWCNRVYVGAQYYDPLDQNELMCEECAKDYFQLIPYKNYKK